MVSRIVFGVLFVAALALSGFLLYLTLTRDDVPMRGFVLAAGILGVGVYSLVRAIKGSTAAERPEPRPED